MELEDTGGEGELPHRVCDHGDLGGVLEDCSPAARAHGREHGVVIQPDATNLPDDALCPHVYLGLL